MRLLLIPLTVKNFLAVHLKSIVNSLAGFVHNTPLKKILKMPGVVCDSLMGCSRLTGSLCTYIDLENEIVYKIPSLFPSRKVTNFFGEFKSLAQNYKNINFCRMFMKNEEKLKTIIFPHSFNFNFFSFNFVK